jgi:hypothetical protein
MRMDRSQCDAESFCNPDCTIDGLYQRALCVDGCPYTLNDDYTVVSRTLAYSTYTSLNLIGGFPIYLPGSTGISNIFTAGAQGELIYRWEAVEGGYKPKYDKPCYFQFNGNSCTCNFFYCDPEKTVAQAMVDCSAFPGGAVLDLCADTPNELSPNSLSLLEILWYLPQWVYDGAAPVAGPTVAPEVPSSIGTTAGPTTTMPTTDDGEPSSIPAPTEIATTTKPMQSPPIGVAPSTGVVNGTMQAPTNVPFTAAVPSIGSNVVTAKPIQDATVCQ